MNLINPEVRLETTNFCNARCTICPREKMTRPMMTMDLEHYKTIVDQVADLGAEEISPFGYGEPLMDKGIVAKVAYANSRHLATFLTTNASLLNETKGLELIDSGLSHIRFSVHGVGKAYEEVHLNLSWKKTKGNIVSFLKSNAERGYPVKVDLSFIPMGIYTQDDIDNIIAMWENAGINDIEMWKPHNWTTGRGYREVTLRKKTCGRPQRGPIQIQADGKAIVCCFDFDGVLTVGDTHNETIQKILRGDRYREIRHRHEDGNLEGLLCETCDQLNEGDSPLLYSTVDKGRESGRTSSTKFRLL